MDFKTHFVPKCQSNVPRSHELQASHSMHTLNLGLSCYHGSQPVTFILCDFANSDTIFTSQDEEAVRKLTVGAGTKSKLAKPIQDLIKMIFDVESMKKAMVEFEVTTHIHVPLLLTIKLSQLEASSLQCIILLQSQCEL